MKHLILVLGCVIGLCYTTKSFAQNYEEEIIEEKNIILDDKNNESKTTIEIKNGKLYVDGKKVSDIDKNTKVKIVKKNTFTENNDIDIQQFDMPFNMPMRKSFRMISPRKAMLGVLTEDANPGAKINEVVKGSAAEKAGLQEGDIITGINGDKIKDYKDLVAAIGEYNKGDEIEIEVYRNDDIRTLTATLGGSKSTQWFGNNDTEEQYRMPFKSFREMFDMPNDGKMIFNYESSQSPKIGLEIEESENGLVIMNVTPNSAADKAGLQEGDEIKTIEGRKVNNLNDLKEEIKTNKKNKEIYMGIKRNGAIKSLPVVLPRAKKRAQF